MIDRRAFITMTLRIFIAPLVAEPRQDSMG
jgi:hypothetical protein